MVDWPSLSPFLVSEEVQTNIEPARHLGTPGGFASAVRQCKRKVRQEYAASWVDTKAYVKAD